jgi:site-specific DNA-methyltransferase (adenine-specific)
MGSGTTAEACVKSNRNFIGFEINQEYIEVSKNRIKKITNQNKLF